MVAENILNLKHFIGSAQLSVMRSSVRGEEGEYFKVKIEEIKKLIAAMPKTYETDGQGDAAPVTLHYFLNGSDWYIIERDSGREDDEIQGIQSQAFGFACLNGDCEMAEFGYISIAELIQCGVELDLYYKPQTVRDIKIKYHKIVTEPESGPSIGDLDEWFSEGMCPAVDGCGPIELDGKCEHGSPSWFLKLGLV